MSPIDFEIELIEDTWVGFVPPQNSTVEGWVISDLPREDTLWEFLPVFNPALGHVQLTYPRYYQLYIPAALISGFSIVTIVGGLLVSRRRLPGD
jgi:hypothetical protein